MIGFIEIIKYLKEFLICYSWYEDNVKEQARSLFTSYCLLEDIEADTNRCDTILADLYSAAELGFIMDFKDFENYMLEYIV